MLNKTVLVVERDPSEAAKIVDFFKTYGFRSRIEVAGSKAEALDYMFQIRACHEMPGLALLDLIQLFGLKWHERIPEPRS